MTEESEESYKLITTLQVQGYETGIKADDNALILTQPVHIGCFHAEAPGYY